MTTFLTTARNALRYMIGTDLISDIDAGFEALADDVDTNIAGYSQDTLAKRPAPGQPNRIFRATDTGVTYHDTGSAWEALPTTVNALSTLSIVGPYGAMTARAVNTAYEPSATRPTLVCMTVAPVTGNISVTVEVGGVVVGRLYNNAGSPVPFTFIVPAGQKWQYKEGGGASVQTSYLTI